MDVALMFSTGTASEEVSSVPSHEVPEGHFHDLRLSGVCKSYEGVEVLREAELLVPTGRRLAVLGPSGCGKTTLLRAIAGLAGVDSGEVWLGDWLLTGDSVHIPPEKRRIGMLFQQNALFPHLSVGQNVGYGLPRHDRAERVAEILSFVKLEGFERRVPGTLSGGQQQRVAMARALAPRPRVMLLDEPFQGIDAQLRRSLCVEVRDMLNSIGATAVIVTHDPDEAFILGNEVAVMKDGKILQQGDPDEVFNFPVTPWVADFLGETNFLCGTAEGSSALTPLGEIPIRRSSGGDVSVLVRPSHVTLMGSAERGGVMGHIEARSYFSEANEYRVRVNGTALIARSSRVPRFQVGERVRVAYEGPVTAAYARSDLPGDMHESV